MAKTSLFRSIRRAFYLAEVAEENGIPAHEVAEWEQERQLKTINRREFLQKAALGLGGIAALSLLPSMKWLPNEKPKIVILGAGMAGLYAARTLKKAGIHENVMIYEASNRHGGRMMTAKLNGNSGTTELGGEFVDTDHTYILNLAQEFGIQKLYRSTDNLKPELFWMDGKAYLEADFVRAFQAIRKKIGKDSRKKGEAREALDRMNLKTYLQDLNCELWFKKLLEIAYVGEYGLDAEEQSALNFVDLVGKQKKGTFSMFGTSDEAIKLLGGNQQLCDRMAAELAAQIIYDAPLIGIRDKGEGFELSFQNMKQAVNADIVINTIPFSVLRTLDGMKDLKAMTKEKWHCIQSLGMGKNGKYFLEQNERVWRKEGYQGYLYTPNIHTAWDSYHLQNDNKGKSIYSVFLGGEAGANIHAGGAAAFVPEINQAFPGFEAQYTGFNKQMNWYNFPWSKGSYICPKPGQYTDIVEEIAKPVGKMLFAGEHVSENYGGFMNGAAETGDMAAKAVIKTLQKG